MKTTAKVEHRDYVPSWYLAVTFCNVYFYGFRAKEMETKWREIKKMRFAEYDLLVKQNEIKIQYLLDTANEIRNNVKKNKPFYRFWYNKVEKHQIATADEYLYKAEKLEEETKELKNKRIFDVYDSLKKIEELLQQNGFVLTHTSSRGEECVTKTEVWTLEE